MFEHWVIDASRNEWPPCFCPLEGDPHGEYQIVFGLNVIAERPPEGKVVGIIHQDGPAAIIAFCEKYKSEIDALMGDGQWATD